MVSARASVGLALALALGSCGPGSGADAGPDTLSERKREIVADLANGLLVPKLREFATAAVALEAATAALAAAPEDAAARTAAREAWGEAMGIWEQLEVMQVGPIGMGGATGVTGGMDLRDEIYAWPTVSTCQVDQRTVTDVHADPELLALELVDSRTLAALEYLLFVESEANTCSTASPLNSAGTWAAFTADQIRARRATYAASAATLVAREAMRALTTYETGFAAQLATAGQEGSVFATPQQALNDLAGALLYMDEDARQMKLGEPAGIVGCPTATCPEALESRYALRNTANLLDNLEGFSLLFHGGAPGDPLALGFDDLLVDVGQGALATQVTESIAAARAALEALEDELSVAITSEPAAVLAAYEAYGVPQRLFKVDVVTALDLEPSSPRVGDND